MDPGTETWLEIKWADKNILNPGKQVNTAGICGREPGRQGSGGELWKPLCHWVNLQ